MQGIYDPIEAIVVNLLFQVCQYALEGYSQISERS